MLRSNQTTIVQTTIGDVTQCAFELASGYCQRHPELIQAACIEELVVDDKVLPLEEIGAHVEYLLEEHKLHLTSIDNGVAAYRSE